MSMDRRPLMMGRGPPRPSAPWGGGRPGAPGREGVTVALLSHVQFGKLPPCSSAATLDAGGTTVHDPRIEVHGGDIVYISSDFSEAEGCCVTRVTDTRSDRGARSVQRSSASRRVSCDVECHRIGMSCACPVAQLHGLSRVCHTHFLENICPRVKLSRYMYDPR